MSGCSDSRACPVCGQDMTVYTDYKPFDTVNMTCNHCGFNGYVECGMQCDEDRRASWEVDGLDIADFKPLTYEQRREYLDNFTSLCGELSPEDEALYLGLPYKDPNKVIVVVHGGVAEVQNCPRWVNVEIHDFDNDSEDPEIITEYGKSPVSFDACGFNSVRDQVKDILRTKLNGSPDSLAAELTDEIFDALHITPEKQDGPF